MNSEYIKSTAPATRRLLIGIPMTGLVRAEWHHSLMNLVVPTNWSHGYIASALPQFIPLGYSVANARNLVAQKAVLEGYEWLFFIDHDVILPIDTYIRFNAYIRSEEYPVVGGLYFTKSAPAEPLIYRGRGNSYYDKWKMGDKVTCDGMGLGCHMINVKLLKLMWEEAEWYNVYGDRVKKIFTTPRVAMKNDFGDFVGGMVGTEDLPWYERIMKDSFLERAGWPQLQTEEFPFLCDTNIFCRHIDQAGNQFPTKGEEEHYKP
jgi:hypothetical protein